MYSLLLASRQLYGEFLLKMVAQLLYPAGTDGQGGGKEPMKIRLQAAAETLGLAAWLSDMLGAVVAGLIISVLLLLLLVATLHRPLPPGIADRKKIQIFEFMMRISNEYFGDLVEWLAGPVTRNRLTRFLSALPFWLVRRRTPKWCLIRGERIAGIRCRFYLPHGAAKRTNAALIYIHGGGWCIGRPRFYDGSLLYIAKRLGLAVISIDYSLSPEVKFPTALLECERVLELLHKEKFPELGVDSSRVALIGDSAGGNLCAVLSQRALRAGKMQLIKCHVLVYPVIHMLDFQSPSYKFYYQTYPGTGLLNPKMLIRWYLLYLGIEPTDDNIHLMATNRHLSPRLRENKELMCLFDASQLPPGLPGQSKPEDKAKNGELGKASFCLPKNHWRSNKVTVAAESTLDAHKGGDCQPLADRLAPLLVSPDLCPLVAADLSGLCPALICTAGIDILRDEGILYAQRLRKFGVPVEWKHYEVAYHGILNMCRSAQRAQILDDICEYLGKNLLT